MSEQTFQEAAPPPDDYVLGPDSQVQRGVPCGKLIQHTMTSKIFPGTVRDYWIHVPAQYDASKPACVMVFQDGGCYIDDEVRATVVMDNLIHRSEMPVTIGIFVNPGTIPDAAPRPHTNRPSAPSSTTRSAADTPAS